MLSCWLVLTLLALAAPINHDEDQYVAAALLARTGRPFVDFMYLQTPLQPRPSSWLLLLPGDGLVALRLATATLGAALLAATWLLGRLAGATRDRALAAALLMGSTQAFLFCAALVRNDMLPAVLACSGAIALVAAAQRAYGTAWLWVLGGAAFGGAISAKVSYLPVAAGVALFLLLRWRRDSEPRRAAGDGLAFGIGLAVGLTPCALAWAQAPAAFWYGVFEYGSTAPFRWYEVAGLGWRLTPAGKLVDSLAVLSLGPALPALAFVGLDIGRRRRCGERTPAPALLLECLILAGIVAALLPTPTWRQYFLPLLPPLFARLGLVDDEALPRRALLLPGLAGFVVAGTAAHALDLLDAVTTGVFPPVVASAEGRWIGDRMRQEGATGSIATLSPRVVVDSGMPLDPRFSTGSFVYRTGDALAPDRQLRLGVVSPKTLFAFLDEKPPAAIVTGYEDRENLDPVGLDGLLRRYAEARGYRRFLSPGGKASLYVPSRPATPTHADVPRL